MYASTKTLFNQIYDAKEKLIISKQSLKDIRINNGIERNPRGTEDKLLGLELFSKLRELKDKF